MNDYQVEQSEAKTKELGAVVRGARESHTQTESLLKENQSKKLGFQEKKHQNNLELEILNGNENLNAEMRKRVIDLESSNESLDLFIIGLNKEIPMLNHNFTMSSNALNTAKNNYQDSRRENQGASGLSTNEMNFLKTQSRSRMTFAEKKVWIDRIGMEEFNNLVPLA